MTDTVVPIHRVMELERKLAQAQEDARRHARFLRQAMNRANEAALALAQFVEEHSR